jgi:hypothetical protein
MKHILLSLIITLYALRSIQAQTTVGIGIYPTGTETGIGFRSAKETKLIIDTRITKANWSSNRATSAYITELSFLYRVVLLEKVRLHAGFGFRTDWAGNTANNYYGAVMPVGVEAFPFPFQNAGLFFEAAPFYTIREDTFRAGIRTVAGCVFYFPKKAKPKTDEKL